MATVPLSGTNIRLLSGIPFANDYKHTRWFDTLIEQTNYFNGKTPVHSMLEANFQRIEGKHFIAVNKSIDDLHGTNYVMFQNAHYNSKWFYGFVTKLEYVQKNTTHVHFEIDVFQTWKFEMNFKPSYVVREHCPLWNVDGSPIVNTIDEGLDYGTEYDVIGAESYTPISNVLFLVIIAKSTIHIADGDTSAQSINSSMNGGVQPLSVYIHPFDTSGSTPTVIIGGISYTLTSLKNLLDQIYSVTSAVNNIVSMYITDHTGIDCTYTSPNLTLNTNLFQTVKVVDVVNADNTATGLKTLYIAESFVYSTTEINCGKKYLDFGAVYGATVTFPADYDESKLLMYPYAFTIIDDFKGNRKVLKNEYISGDTLLVDAMGSMGVSNKVSYIPQNYLTQELLSSIDRKSVGIESALIDNTSHGISIITDMLSAFIQGNKNSLQNQANTIVFNGITDVVGSAVGGVGSALMRNPLGVASAGVGMVKGAGNSVLQLQGMQAKLKDINNIPPSMAKMGDNTSFEYGNGYYGFWVITKTIKPEYRKKLTDFFKMYGYKVNEVKTPNFHTRQNWNFVQTESCNILGSFNNEDLQELKNVFDNGITFWHTDDVGNYSLTNGVIA